MCSISNSWLTRILKENTPNTFLSLRERQESDCWNFLNQLSQEEIYAQMSREDTPHLTSQRSLHHHPSPSPPTWLLTSFQCLTPNHSQGWSSVFEVTHRTWKETLKHNKHELGEQTDNIESKRKFLKHCAMQTVLHHDRQKDATERDIPTTAKSS